jgi:hypothetical protein
MEVFVLLLVVVAAATSTAQALDPVRKAEPQRHGKSKRNNLSQSQSIHL